MQIRSLMTPVEAPGGVDATRVGADIRAARERLGWELPEVAQHLRIRLSYLEAIEDGRTTDLPGNAYAIGFLRTYAQALGLDGDEVCRRFRDEARAVNRRTKLEFPAPVPERGVPAGAVVLLGVVLAVGAYAGWYKMSGTGRPDSEPVQPVPPRLMPLAEAPAPLKTDPPRATEPARAAESAPVTPSISPTSAAAAIPAPVAPPPAAAPAPAAPVLAGLPEGTRLVLRAKADAWIQVRDKAGPIVLNRVLKAGETWPVPAKGAFLLTTGNAGGTEILLDGQVTASLGTDGTVRRDLALDPDQVKDGKLAAAAVAPAPAAPRPAAPPKPQ